jgi:hypothetical protein
MQHEDPFAPDVTAAVMRHMNEDHAADALVICRGVGDQPRAVSAAMSGMDRDGINFVAVVEGRDVPVHLPWSVPLIARAQIRGEVTQMYRESCAALGLEVPVTSPIESGSQG